MDREEPAPSRMTAGGKTRSAPLFSLDLNVQVLTHCMCIHFTFPYISYFKLDITKNVLLMNMMLIQFRISEVPFIPP